MTRLAYHGNEHRPQGTLGPDDPGGPDPLWWLPAPTFRICTCTIPEDETVVTFISMWMSFFPAAAAFLMTRLAYHGNEHRPQGTLGPDDPGGPDPLWWLPAPTFHIKVFSDANLVSVGDGKFIFETSFDMAGKKLIHIEMNVTTVSSSGIVQVQIRNITQAVDMLSTRIQCDENEKSSSTAATQPVINAANADVAYPDELAIDVDAAGSGAKGLAVKLWFI